MTPDLMTDFLSTPEDRRLFEQERVILDVTEMICKLMERANISRKELAEMLGTSQANVTQMLNGTRNMTLRTVSDVLFSMDYGLEVGHKWLVSATNEMEITEVYFQADDALQTVWMYAECQEKALYDTSAPTAADGPLRAAG